MPDPFLTAAAISAGSSILGEVLTDDPETPDLSGAVREQTTRARRNLSEQAEQASNRLEENLAASNAAAVTSSSAREEMFDAQSSARAELENRAAEILSDAVRRERLMEFRNQRRQARNRAAGIASIGETLANTAFTQTTQGDGGGGPGPPAVPQVEPSNQPIEPDIDEFDLDLGL